MNLKKLYNKIKYYIETYGFKRTVKKCLSKIKNLLFRKKGSTIDNSNYEEWIKNNEPNKNELEEQRNFKFKAEPKISIIIPMYNTPVNFFEELIQNLIDQTYSNWELCLADGSPEKNDKINKIIEKDKRIKYRFLNENKGIAGNTNEALTMATGDYIGLLDHDDLLPVFCLYEIVKCINENPDTQFIYTDEDKIIGKYRREPYFKPDFSIDTLRSNNYITHFSVFKSELLKEKIGGFRDEYNGSQDYDVILRATENTDKIVHISKILYHWRIHEQSTAMTADAKPYAFEVGQKVLEDYYKRNAIKAKVKAGEIWGIYETEYEFEGKPKVSILIPNKDSIKLLKNCIKSILKLTTYDNYEIIVIENNSEDDKTFEYYETIQKLDKVKVIKYPEKGFNYAKIINFGVKNCDGEFVLQLNSDTKIITPNWLEKFIGFAAREDVGAVGARLYYEDKSIQHAGIVIGICGLAANMLTGIPKGVHAYFGKDCLIQNVSAVTGACLFSKKSIYEEVGYMDEENFAVALNDVDFCLKIRKKGYKIIYNPYIELMHYESKTRGYEDTPEKKARFERESNNFKTKWKDVIEKGDPYYNKNLSIISVGYEVRPDKV